MICSKEFTSHKHAYLIIAHNHPEVLKVLIQLLDDKRNDIYLHIDSKIDIKLFSSISTKNAGLYYTDRIDVRWAHISLVQAEYLLLKTAAERGHYSYYHLLSGVDLPIQSQDAIHSYFNNDSTRNYIGIMNSQESDRVTSLRCDTYSFFLKHQRNRFFGNLIKGLNTYILSPVQKLIRVKRSYPWKLKYGPQWFSITDSFCRYVISMEDKVLSIFQHCTCIDEIFIQTLIWNSPFKNTLKIQEGSVYEATCRLIDWERGTPYSYTINDINEIEQSNMLFCRKIESEELAEMVKKIVEYRTDSKS